MKRALQWSIMCLLIFLISGIFSCSKDIPLNEVPNTEGTIIESVDTKAIPSVPFEWYNVDFMPTPPSDAGITVPWGANGGLASMYGLDVANDYHPSDGWELVYNTFLTDAGPLNNPYFVLYNKYTGLLRIYMFYTGNGLTASSYLKSKLYIIRGGNASVSTSMLNYLSGDIVNVKDNLESYVEILPRPGVDFPPITPRTWYMVEYEIGYDPNIKNIQTNDIRLNWLLSYSNITKFNFEGNSQTQLYAIMGSASKVNNVINQNNSSISNLGDGTFASIGEKMISNAVTGNSTKSIGGVIDGIYSRIDSLIKKSKIIQFGKLTGSVLSSVNAISNGIKAISAIFGKKTTTDNTQYIHGLASTKIAIEGTSENNTGFQNINFLIPGADASAGFPNGHYIPLYNKSLGVIGFNGAPPADMIKHYIENGAAWSRPPVDLRGYVTINPDVLQIAQVDIVDMYPFEFRDPADYYKRAGIIYTFEITPRTGGGAYRILKTLLANDPCRDCGAYPCVCGMFEFNLVNDHNGRHDYCISIFSQNGSIIEEYGSLEPYKSWQVKAKLPSGRYHIELYADGSSVFGELDFIMMNYGGNIRTYYREHMYQGYFYDLVYYHKNSPE